MMDKPDMFEAMLRLVTEISESEDCGFQERAAGILQAAASDEPDDVPRPKGARRA